MTAVQRALARPRSMGDRRARMGFRVFEGIRRSRGALPSLRRLALASACTAGAIGVVCAVAVSSLDNAASAARLSVDRQLSLIDDAVGMRSFFYQKGFVAQYVLTGDRKWLAEPESVRPAFESWLGRANAAAETPASRDLLARIGTEYRAFNEGARDAIALYESGHLDDAKARLSDRALH